MTVPFTKFTTRKWAVLTSKIDKLFIGIGINCYDYIECHNNQTVNIIRSSEKLSLPNSPQKP
jgi:hypothetical protein